MQKLRRLPLSFILFVVLPTLIAALYYGLSASDVYSSEARFLVRNPQRSSQSGLGALLQGTALSSANHDAPSVHDYVLSRDALHELDDKLGLRAAFSNLSIDWLNRFPGPIRRNTFEDLHDYYTGKVEVSYDSGSSITVMRVHAYSQELARDINESLLQMSERLVNTLNQRSRDDLINVAEREVNLAEERVKAAALALASFRTDRTVFDPNSESALQLQTVARLQDELIAIEAQLTHLLKVSPENPQVQPLKQRVESLRKVIIAERSKVTGGGRGSLSAKSPAYDRLLLEKTFADRQLAESMAGLSAARSDSVRKQLYLERLVQPSLPDASLEPRRLRSVITVLVLGLVAWGVASLVLAGVREHVD